MNVIDLEFASRVAEIIEFVAISVIAIAVAAAMIGGGLAVFRAGWPEAFNTFKVFMARGLLVGLDLLIAADIIKSVTLEPTLDNIVGLGLLVLIRTFLSWALVLEATGRWPWQRGPLLATAAEHAERPPEPD
jgi:uncharacterized membrane protein